MLEIGGAVGADQQVVVLKTAERHIENGPRLTAGKHLNALRAVAIGDAHGKLAQQIVDDVVLGIAAHGSHQIGAMFTAMSDSDYDLFVIELHLVCRKSTGLNDLI